MVSAAPPNPASRSEPNMSLASNETTAIMPAYAAWPGTWVRRSEVSVRRWSRARSSIWSPTSDGSIGLLVVTGAFLSHPTDNLDVTSADGTNVGLNPTQTLYPGESKTFYWYAGAIEAQPDGTLAYTPMELGVVVLRGAAVLRVVELGRRGRGGPPRPAGTARR